MQVKYYKQYYELIEHCKAPDGLGHLWKEDYLLVGGELRMTFENCQFCHLKRGRILRANDSVDTCYSDKDVDYPALMGEA